MPWVRFDDQFPIHRKVKGLSDTAFRLHVEAIFWCARNLTDGFVPAEDLPDLASARRPLKFVPELVTRGSWHLVDEECGSEQCPVAHHRNDVDGWVIHDYWEYQPSKAKVADERKTNAERQRRWRDQRKPDRHAVSNGVSNAVSNSAPSRPDPSLDADASRERARAPVDGFELTDGLRRWVVRTFGPALDPDHEAKQFVSHYRSTGAKRPSWPDAFQKWCRDSAKHAAERAARTTPTGGQRPSTTEQRVGQAGEIAARLRAEEAS